MHGPYIIYLCLQKMFFFIIVAIVGFFLYKDVQCILYVSVPIILTFLVSILSCMLLLSKQSDRTGDSVHLMYVCKQHKHLQTIGCSNSIPTKIQNYGRVKKRLKIMISNVVLMIIACENVDKNKDDSANDFCDVWTVLNCFEMRLYMNT